MRYLGLIDADRRSMLDAIGVDSIDALYHDVPEVAVLKTPLGLPGHTGEMKVEQQIAKLVSTNRRAGAGACFLGAGSYNHHVPASVDHLIQRGEFLTSYTPYQPEIAQGRLEGLHQAVRQRSSVSSSSSGGPSACSMCPVSSPCL